MTQNTRLVSSVVKHCSQTSRILQFGALLPIRARAQAAPVFEVCSAADITPLMERPSRSCLVAESNERSLPGSDEQ